MDLSPRAELFEAGPSPRHLGNSHAWPGMLGAASRQRDTPNPVKRLDLDPAAGFGTTRLPIGDVARCAILALATLNPHQGVFLTIDPDAGADSTEYLDFHQP